MNQLAEYYKIIQRFSSLYAGEGDVMSKLQLADCYKRGIGSEKLKR